MFTEMRRRVKRVVYTLQAINSATASVTFEDPMQVHRTKKDAVRRLSRRMPEHLVPKMHVTNDFLMIH
jgi:hypothetical protein